MATKVSPSPAVTTSWTYLLNGAINTLTDTAGNSIAYGYDTALRRTSETQTIPGLSGAKAVSYMLDAAGNRTRLTWPDGYLVNYTYDALNRMATAADTTQTLATYTYDPLSRRTALSYGSGGASGMSYAYALGGDLLTLTDNLTGTTNDVTFTNTFNNAHQLATETTSNSAYLWQATTASTSAYTANTLNEYSALNGATMAYDANGNFRGSAAAPSLAYDAENRLLSITTPASTYVYDPLGRRVQKTVSGTVTSFVHDGDNEIAEYDTTGTLSRRFVPGPAIDDYIAMVTSSMVRTFFHTDHHGSVIAMSDTSGNLAEGPYTYDPYGNCFTGTSNCYNTLPASTVPFKYTGQRLDPEQGFYYYRARMYSAGLGRFLQTDPVGYKDDFNRYTYVGNDPTNESDPSGLCDGSRIDAASDSICGGTKDPKDPKLGAGSPKNQTTHPPQKAFVGPIPIARAGGTAATEFVGAAIARMSAVLSALSLCSDTPAGCPSSQGDNNLTYLNHYTNNVGRAGIMAMGAVRPSGNGNVYVTPDVYGTGSAAQAHLALGQTPTGYFRIPMKNFYSLNGPTEVQRASQQPGGGVEYTNTGPVSISGAQWIDINSSH